MGCNCSSCHCKETDETKDVKLLRNYIINNTSVLNHSDLWGSYYDFMCAGKETLTEFLSDSVANKNQVKKFLESYTDEELYIVRKTFDNKERDLSDKILKKMGYKYSCKGSL